MAITNKELKTLQETTVSRELIQTIFKNNEYYIKPLVFIEDELNLTLNCTGFDYKNAVEIAHDEDVCPPHPTLRIIVDGVLACIYHEELEKCGMNLTTYFTYRFTPPSQDFQNRIDQFHKGVSRMNSIDQLQKEKQVLSDELSYLQERCADLEEKNMELTRKVGWKERQVEALKLNNSKLTVERNTALEELSAIKNMSMFEFGDTYCSEESLKEDGHALARSLLGR